MAGKKKARSAAGREGAEPDAEALVSFPLADEPDLFVVPDDLLELVAPELSAPALSAPALSAPGQSDAALAPDRASISARAHAIHLERGGTAFDNWIAAEREIGGA